MKANELMIGNWISTSFLDEERLMIISEIGEFNVVCENKETDAQCGFKVIYPIPLTEEWLVKFGFENKTKTFVLNNISIKQQTKGYFFYLSIMNQYVHQLQNLYFALTGEELKIN